MLGRLGKLAKKSKDGKVPVKDVITNSGSKKYLQLDSADKKAEISFVKADSDAAWDGISGYITNSKRPVGEVIANYRRLWEIEDAFRLCKNDVEPRTFTASSV